ncbi:PTS galactitol transporter subunit IIA [Histophilus somni]|uniref:PTS system galactitol-specific EIIA component, Gat family n=1 Tax=Histophilus somni (strain 129Pt) TaxID=205914 RepID=Q0I402_HISS1|nr:PTS galactitol transporter subunit IIA [Histophilus somni]ACA30745.1 putative PTS IIA-like nitrogen-regulatory protein PtsN [Histophilus somni 2336]
MVSEILIKTGISFENYSEALNHIADELIAKGFVKESYRDAVFAREANFPTGIQLEEHSVAIPHCEAEHSIKPAIYFIRPDKTLVVNRADDDGTVDAEILMALVVTNPQQQLRLLRTLFGKLQDNSFVTQLLSIQESDLSEFLKQHFEI